MWCRSVPALLAGSLGLTWSPGRLVPLLPWDEIWATWPSECVEGSQMRQGHVQRLRGKEVDGLFGTSGHCRLCAYRGAGMGVDRLETCFKR